MIPPPHRQTRGGIIAPRYRNHRVEADFSALYLWEEAARLSGTRNSFVQWRAFVALYLETTLSVFSPRYRLAVPREKRSNGRSFSIEKKSLRVHLSRSPNSSSPYSREGTALPCGFTRFSIFLFFPFFINSCERLSLETLTVRKA